MTQHVIIIFLQKRKSSPSVILTEKWTFRQKQTGRMNYTCACIIKIPPVSRENQSITNFGQTKQQRPRCVFAGAQLPRQQFPNECDQQCAHPATQSSNVEVPDDVGPIGRSIYVQGYRQ